MYCTYTSTSYTQHEPQPFRCDFWAREFGIQTHQVRLSAPGSEAKAPFAKIRG